MPPRSRRRSPGAPTPAGRADRPAPCPTRTLRPTTERRAPERSRYMGLEPGTPMRGCQGRPRLHRLLHQRPDRGSARRRRGRPRAAGRRRRPGDGRSRLALVKLQAEAEGLDEVFKEAGFEWRERRLLDVPGHEPGHAGARRALRLDLQPQLRGPPGQGRAHPPGSPAMAAAAADRPAISPTSGRCRDEAGSRRHRPRGRPRPDRRRHRPDHPEAVPEADRAHGFGEFLFWDWAKDPDFPLNRPSSRARRSWSPAVNFGFGLVARAARLGASGYGFEAIIAPSFSDIFMAKLRHDRPAGRRARRRQRPGAARQAPGRGHRRPRAPRRTLPSGREVAFAIDDGDPRAAAQRLFQIALTERRDDASSLRSGPASAPGPNARPFTAASGVRAPNGRRPRRADLRSQSPRFSDTSGGSPSRQTPSRG